MPKVYEQLMDIRKKLESHYKEMQDIEFTVEEGTLYMLQTRTGKRTGSAAVRIAVEMVKEDSSTSPPRSSGSARTASTTCSCPSLTPRRRARSVARGIAASPGAACGKVILSAEAAVDVPRGASRRADPSGPQGDQP